MVGRGVVGGGAGGGTREDFFCIWAARKPRASFPFWRVAADPSRTRVQLGSASPRQLRKIGSLFSRGSPAQMEKKSSTPRPADGGHAMGEFVGALLAIGRGLHVRATLIDVNRRGRRSSRGFRCRSIQVDKGRRMSMGTPARQISRCRCGRRQKKSRRPHGWSAQTAEQPEQPRNHKKAQKAQKTAKNSRTARTAKEPQKAQKAQKTAKNS